MITLSNYRALLIFPFPVRIPVPYAYDTITNNQISLLLSSSRAAAAQAAAAAFAERTKIPAPLLRSRTLPTIIVPGIAVLQSHFDSKLLNLGN